MRRKTLSTFRSSALCTAVLLLVSAAFWVGTAPSPASAATLHTPVMGSNLLTADQLTHWFNTKRARAAQPRLPALNNDVHALAQIFLDEGRAEGVRGDIAFVQSVIETGWFVFADNGQIRPEFNNYAGINANNGRRIGTTCADEVLDAPALSRCFPTPQIGVRAQIQLLRGYADPLSRNLPNRLRMPPSDRIGLAPWWEYFGGNSPTGKLIWASAPDYGVRIVQMFSDVLMFNNMPPVDGYPDVDKPVALLSPDVAASQGSSPFTVGWWGQDFETGIQTFLVDVSDNGGPWIRWLQDRPIDIVAAQASGRSSFFGRVGHTYAFRVSAVDRAGNVSAPSASESTAVGASVAWPSPFTAAYALAGNGDVAALSSTPVQGPSWGGNLARSMAATPTGTGGYVLDLYGGVHSIGGAPDMPGSAYRPGWDIARSIALNPDGQGGYVLDGWGGLHPIGNAKPATTTAYWSGWDIARDVVLLRTSTATNPAGYVLDGFGGVHPFGNAPQAPDAPYWNGWNIARDVIANPVGNGGWVLDGWGGMHAFGGAPNLATSAFWNGWDIARSAAIWNTASGLRGYVLDGYGGLHPINGAPNVTSTRYWGQDIARSVTVTP